MPEQETVVATETPVEQAQQAQKVTFDDAQKARINQIVADASRRAGEEARAEADRLKRELDAAKAIQTPVDNSALELATTKAELSALKRDQQESALLASLRSAAGDLFLDSELGTRLMRDSVRVGADGAPYVVGADGAPALNSAFEKMSLRELAQQVANQRKYLARGEVKPGSGSTPSLGNFSSAPRLEDLFGPNSNGGLANKLALKSRSEYLRLRQLAHQKGLI